VSETQEKDTKKPEEQKAGVLDDFDLGGFKVV
jgi:hypothetical protein